MMKFAILDASFPLRQRKCHCQKAVHVSDATTAASSSGFRRGVASSSSAFKRGKVVGDGVAADLFRPTAAAIDSPARLNFSGLRCNGDVGEGAIASSSGLMRGTDAEKDASVFVARLEEESELV